MSLNKWLLVGVLVFISGCTTVQTHSYSNAPVVNDSYNGG